jgi:hypothetical protein
VRRLVATLKTGLENLIELFQLNGHLVNVFCGQIPFRWRAKFRYNFSGHGAFFLLLVASLNHIPINARIIGANEHESHYVFDKQPKKGQETMLQAIVQSHEALSNFLSLFRDAFQNRPQYRHFQAYVIGLIIYLGSRNLAGLSRAVPDGKSPCSLYRFMAEMDWDSEQVEQVRWEMLNRRTRRALAAAGGRGKPLPVFLAIDDSLVEKSGKCMEGAAYHYSHSAGRTLWGHAWVTAQLVVLGQSYPVSWRLYRRRTMCEEVNVPLPPSQNWHERWSMPFEPLPVRRPMS